MFSSAFVTSSIVYCSGPMTVIGCAEEAFYGKSQMMMFKSVINGWLAIFFAATLGTGTLLSAAFVLIYQILLTLFFKIIKPYVKDSINYDDISGVGGVILLAIALGILKVVEIPAECFLPAFLLVPFFSKLFKFADHFDNSFIKR